MSALDIGYRILPNLYVDFVYSDRLSLSRPGDVPKLTVYFVLKDVIINNKPLWTEDPIVINDTNIVVSLENKNGHTYHTFREPIRTLLNNPSIEMDSKDNTVYVHKFNRTIDVKSFYADDKSLIIKTYVEKKYEDNSTRTSAIMREVVQNTNGTTPEQSFYFTLENGEVYAGPYHYHAPTDQFMVGEKHTDKPHPKLNITYVSNKAVNSSAIEKVLNYKNTNKLTYDFDPKKLSTNYITVNSNKSITNLFVYDLYRILLSSDPRAQKLFELNKSLFNELSQEIRFLEFNMSRVVVGETRKDNILQTPVIKSVETSVEKRLITLHGLREGKQKNSNAEIETYYDDGVLYVIATDNQVKNEIDASYKYITNIKLKSTIPQYIDRKIKNLEKVKAYYEIFLGSLINPDHYNSQRDKLKDSFVRSIFEDYTNFEVDGNNNIIMNQKPEFHKHIDTFMEAVALLKSVNQSERNELHTTLNQLINPLETSKRQINNFIKLVNDLLSQIRLAYKISRNISDRTSMKNTSIIQMQFRDNEEVEYSRKRKSFSVFKNLNKPIVSVSSLKKRFTTERNRYFQKNKGDVSFSTLTPEKRTAFVSDKNSRFTFLTPISLQTMNKNIDLENFDMFEQVVDDIYDNPRLKLNKKIASTLTLLKPKISHIDAADFLSEASDFIINKIKLKPNVLASIDPIVLNYTFPLNSIVDIDLDKFDLSKQENLLLQYTKIIPENQVVNTLREIPFQTKSLFYPGNVKNPLNRIKQSSSFKVKRLIKNISFTTYKMEYLHGYDSTNQLDGFRSIYRPHWRDMEDPAKIISNAKYVLLKISVYDRFGFKSAEEFATNQKFVLMRNKKYIQSATTINSGIKFTKNYTPDDFIVQSFQTLNLLDNDIEATNNLSKEDTYEYDASHNRLALLLQVAGSQTPNNRSRQAVKSRAGRVSSPTRRTLSTGTAPVASPSQAAPVSTPTAPTSGGGGY